MIISKIPYFYKKYSNHPADDARIGKKFYEFKYLTK
jgi:hypothetical protein